MRRRTGIVLALSFILLFGLVIGGMVGYTTTGGTLSPIWVSDTARENQVNHHAVGAGPQGLIIVAPVAEVPNAGVTLTDTSCALVRLAPTNGSVLWRAGIPSADCFTHALTEPELADIDGDGRLEVIVASTENALIAYTALTGVEKWRVPMETYGYGRPTKANITPAPGLEVVVSDINGGVLVVSATGQIEWEFNLNATEWTGPVVWDAPHVGEYDGDARPEILIGSSKGPVLLSNTGTLEWSENGSAREIATTDTDNDGTEEIYTAGVRTLRKYNEGQIVWERQFTRPTVTSITDGDQDTEHEVYIGEVGGRVHAISADTGTIEWSTQITGTGTEMVAAPIVGDVTGDGNPEVVAVTESGTVSVLSGKSGTEIGAYQRNVPIWTTPILTDLTNDETDEILVRYGDGRVVALDYT